MSQAPVAPKMGSLEVENFKPKEWNFGLFQCLAPGCVPCLYTWFCTPCANAQARTDYDQSNCFFNCLCVNPVMMQNIVREGLGIEGTCCNDILTACCCTPCAVGRASSELKLSNRQQQLKQPGQDGAEAWGSSLVPQPGMPCLYTCFCSPCANASSRSAYDDSNWTLNCCCASPALVRSVVREGYGIEGTWVNDCLCGCCCPLCSICQVQREIETRGPKKTTTPF